MRGDASTLRMAHSSWAQRQQGLSKSFWAAGPFQWPPLGARATFPKGVSTLGRARAHVSSLALGTEAQLGTQQAPPVPQVPWLVQSGLYKWFQSLVTLPTPRKECHLATSYWEQPGQVGEGNYSCLQNLTSPGMTMLVTVSGC